MARSDDDSVKLESSEVAEVRALLPGLVPVQSTEARMSLQAVEELQQLISFPLKVNDTQHDMCVLCYVQKFGCHGWVYRSDVPCFLVVGSCQPAFSSMSGCMDILRS